MTGALELSELTAEDADHVAATLERKFVTMTSAEAYDRLRGARVPCEIPAKEPYMPKLFWEDWAVQSGQVFVQDDSMHGPIREVGLYMHLSDTPGQRKGPAARLGHHTAEVLRELGYSDERITALAAEKAVYCEPR
jgi:crotonobetainyl-CoA:carnitine CoA-transferase CaiB-like acyl-CoA transferase